jgi:hypothetical protein
MPQVYSENMSTTTRPIPDALGLLATLTIADVRDRLDALEAERRALMTLLRSLRARERARLAASAK